MRADTSGQSRPGTLFSQTPAPYGGYIGGQYPLPPASVQIDGTHLTAVVTSDKLANRDYVCMGLYGIASYTGHAPVEWAHAWVDGFYEKPSTVGWGRARLKVTLSRLAEQTKIGAILKSGGSRAGFGPPAPCFGVVKIVWTVGRTVVATTGTAAVDSPMGVVFEVKLTKAGRALLKRAKKSITVTATGSYTPDHLKTETASRRITLKR